MGNYDYEIAILGAGPAGLTAGIYAARSMRKTAVLEKGVPGGQIAMTDLIENYPGFPDGISGMELMKRFEKQVNKFEVELIPLFEVKKIKIKDRSKIVESSEGKEIKSKSVIIATGQNPRTLNVPGESQFTGKGVSYCATCDGPFFKDKVVTVVGGGNSAIQEADYLSRFAEKVYVIHRRDELRADKILQERALNNEKIEIIWDSVVTEVMGENSVEAVKVKNVKTEDLTELKTQGFFVYIGYIPNTKFLDGLVNLDHGGYIKTNTSMQTSREGIFACGDVRANPLKQVSVAVGEGAIAAVSADNYIENIS